MWLCGLEVSRKHSERVCREADLRSSQAPAHSTRRGRVTRNASSWAPHHVNSRRKFALCKWPANGSAAAPPPRLRSAEHDEVSRVALMPRSFSSAHGLRTRKPCGLPPCSRLRSHPGACAAHRCAQHRAYGVSRHKVHISPHCSAPPASFAMLNERGLMWSRWTSSCDSQIMLKMMFTDHLESVLSNFEQIFSGAEGENFGFLSKIFSMAGYLPRSVVPGRFQLSGAGEAWEAGISWPKLG